MYLSLSWLKQFVKFKQTPEQVAEILTNGGFEVEEIIKVGQGLDKILVGEIKTIVSHAEANKLVVCKVDVGRKRLLNIVCGAQNIKPGHKVPVAPVGAVLPNGLKIERRRIRGVDSEGMLCAEDELKLGDDHAGIMILNKDLKIGKKLGQATGYEDTVLDIAVTPNRADCFSVLGLAREFAALANLPLLEKKVSITESKKYSIKNQLTAQIRDYNLCPKYTARLVKNVNVKPSPQWLQARLLVVGVKPINNIVDISNYVMLELGQPLHTFDYDYVKGKKIIVRKAGPDKKFVTLDSETRQLLPDMLVIADAREPIAVAGVMGGKNSEITKGTKDVVIESAIFKPVSIRKTRQKLGVVTEASTRFEKGIAWGLPEKASNLAAQMMAEIAGGEVVQGMIEVSQQKSVKAKVLKLSLDYLNNLIGRKFSQSEVKDILTRLSFQVTESSQQELKVQVPVWRQDVSIPADLVEEVGRVYGWNNIKPAPVYAALQPASLPLERQWERLVKDTLVSCGMTEVLNYSFYAKELLEQFGLKAEDHYQVVNPLNPEQEYMRITLMPRLLENVMKNYQAREGIKLFEIGHVYYKTGRGLPDERTMLAGIIYEKGKKEFSEEPIQQLKNVLATLYSRLNVAGTAKQGGRESISIVVQGETIGKCGWLKYSAQKLGRPPVWFEIDLTSLIKYAAFKKPYKQLADFPAIERDMTFKTPLETSYHEIIRLIRKIDPLITSVQGVDLYKESDDSRSITLRVVYQAKDRTLKSDEVEVIAKKIIKEVANKFYMELKK